MLLSPTETGTKNPPVSGLAGQLDSAWSWREDRGRRAGPLSVRWPPTPRSPPGGRATPPVGRSGNCCHQRTPQLGHSSPHWPPPKYSNGTPIIPRKHKYSKSCRVAGAVRSQVFFYSSGSVFMSGSGFNSYSDVKHGIFYFLRDPKIILILNFDYILIFAKDLKSKYLKK